MAQYRGSHPDRNDRQRSDRNPIIRPFVGVDGEGGNLAGSHEYLLLRAGDAVLETGKPLRPDECFDFLAALQPGRLYVSYYFDYDVTMMVRSLPEERIRRLLSRSARTIPGRGQPNAVDVDGFQIDYLPHKEFRVRRRLPNEGKKRKYDKWVVISDVGSFFQCSFVAALRRWFGTSDGGVWTPNPGEAHWADIIDKIEDGKQQRNSFGAVTEDEREYNLLEIRALEALMAKFRTMCGRVDLNPGKWQGPGNLVMAQFRRVGLPRNRDYTVFRDTPGLLELANSAYYGGRFEACVFGEIT